ncbi:MAG: amidohydrolase family protein [Acidimicrobiia bacterium]
MLDTLIRDVQIVDGTGTPRTAGALGIVEGRLVMEVGPDEPARNVVDGEGLIAAPGFVDIHTHYDAQLSWDPMATPSMQHGVTTVIGGNCGFGVAPLNPSDADYLIRMLEKVEGMPAQSLRDGLSWDWTSFGTWLDRFEGAIALNAGFLVGHSTLRRAAMGPAAGERPATDRELVAMSEILHEALDAGALGFSTSRSVTHSDGDGRPVPSRLSDADELLLLAACLKDHPGTSLEMIPEDVHSFDDATVDLMVGMSLASGRPLNWNLLVLSSQTPDEHPGLLRASVAARARGARVVALTLPEVQRLSVTLASGFLFDALPGWAPVMSLPIPERIAALQDGRQVEALRAGAEEVARSGGVLGRLAHWDDLVVAETFSPQNRGAEGKRLGEIAVERRTVPFTSMLDIAVSDELRTRFIVPGAGEDPESWAIRAEVWRDPHTVIGGSDAGAHLDMICGATYSTSLLGNAVRKMGLLSLEQAVHQLTDVPARLYGLRHRGRLLSGWHADVVLFDETSVGPRPARTRADLPGGAHRIFAEADGVEKVFVNGVKVLDRAEYTGRLPGRVMRSGRDTGEPS